MLPRRKDPLPFLNTFGISEACLLLIAGSLPALGPLFRRARARLASYSGSGWSVTEIGGRYLRSKRSHSTSHDDQEKRKVSDSSTPPLTFHGYDIHTAAAARRKASDGSEDQRTLTLDDDVESRAGLRDDSGSGSSDGSPSTTNMTRLSPPPMALAPLRQQGNHTGEEEEETSCCER